MTPPPGVAPELFQVCFKGLPDLLDLPLRVDGANFQPGSQLFIGGLPVATTFVNSSVLLGSTPIFGGADPLDVTVLNPDLQQATLETFFHPYPAPGAGPRFRLTLPNLQAGYRMFSIPQYASISDLRASLEAELGPYNTSLYRVFFLINGVYVELNSVPADYCDLSGDGFWAITRFGAEITLFAPDVKSNLRGSGPFIRVVPVFPGWNLISMPFSGGGMMWSAVGVTNDGANLATSQPADAAPALLTPILFGYDGIQYFNEPVMNPGVGYAIFNVTPGMVYLTFDCADLMGGLLRVVPGGGGGFTSSGGPGSGGGLLLLIGKPLPPGTERPPSPPASSFETEASSSSSDGGSCGLLGFEVALLLLVFRRSRRRRRLSA